MSEFHCYNGHLMPSGQTICHCGESIHTMDGHTDKQLNQMEHDELVRPDEDDE